MLEDNNEKIGFVMGELKNISQELKKSGGMIAEVNNINLSNDPITSADITIVWADRHKHSQKG